MLCSVTLSHLHDVFLGSGDNMETETECPDCHSKNVESKGYRGVNHRYICGNCQRNFTVHLEPALQEKTNSKTNIQISREIRSWLEGLKLHRRESINDVLKRLKISYWEE